MENEYPIPIANHDSEMFMEHRGGIGTFHWTINNVAEGQYQLALTLKDEEEVLYTRDFAIRQVMDERRVTYRMRVTFLVDDYTYYVESVVPSEDDLFFMLRVFVRSNPYYDDGRALDFCEECAFAIPICLDDHLECSLCDELRPIDLVESFDVVGDDTYYVCVECDRDGHSIFDIDGIVACTSCEGTFQSNYAAIYYNTVIGQGEGWYCESCTEDYYSCVECGVMGDYDDMSDAADDDGFGELYCPDCMPEAETMLAAWNFRPDFVFWPSIPVDPLKPLYIGVEFELQWPGWQTDALPWLEMIRDEYADLMYAKEDSSIDDGFELTTMPMSPEWALSNFPFEVLTEAMDAGAYERHRSTGVHIHIDRGALTTAQMWKILKVHKSQRKLCGIVGGRGTKTSYANWDDGFTPVTDNMYQIARRKGEAFGDAERYVPVNLMNEDTIELRYMEGTLNIEEIKKNIEWVQALYDFTDHISVEDVKNGVLESSGPLLGWIMESAMYPNLAGYLSPRLMAPTAMPVRTSVCA